jgi:RNA polymerase sigma-70 factor, ECF subfamily
MPDVLTLIQESRAGNGHALDQLMPLVYEQLRSIARRQMIWEKPGHSLRATDLAHEVYLKMVGGEISFVDQAHFYALAAKLSRQVLLDHAKARRRQKRGGGAVKVALEEGAAITVDDPETFLAIHQALERLEQLDPRKAEIVELVYFGGLQQDMAAAALSISPATLRRDLRLARAWLYNELRTVRDDSP